MEEIRKVKFCPHCGNRSPQKLLHEQYGSGVGWSLTDDEEVDFEVAYFVALCETCDGILVYRAVDEIPDAKHFTACDLVFPQSGELHKSIPVGVAKIYGEAARIKMIAPNAFAVQIRRALEAVCEDRGAQSGNLQKRLKDLSERGEIPTVLAQVSDALRLLGNVGAHATANSIRPWQVYAIDDFFRAIVEYVYVAPSKLREFQLSSAHFKSKANAEDDSGAA
jgi:hypothetical protein